MITQLFNLRVSIMALSFIMIFSACQRNDDPMILSSTMLKNQKIIVDGLEREFHIQTPDNSENHAVVILLHGHTGSFDQSIGDELSTSPQKVWLSVADQNQFIVVVPNGTLGPENTRGWNDCRNDAKGNPDNDDVAFIDQLLELVKEQHNHDEKRVYIAGVSNGAAMAMRLAQELPEKITAIAAVVNSMPANSECNKSQIPISALLMNGTEDPLAPYEGGEIASDRGLVLSTDATIEYWVARNQTDTLPIIENIPNIDQNDNSTITKSTYGNGINKTEVVLYKVLGGGHAEPSIQERFGLLYSSIVGDQNGDIEMAEELWEFFKNKSN